MTEEKEYLRFPGYVSVKEAAAILGLKENRVWYYIRLNRLPARKIDGRSMIPEQAVQDFHIKPRGRVRTDPPPWRAYRGGANVCGLQIITRIEPAQLQSVQDRLQSIEQEQTYLFPGTMQRYIFVDENDPHILLVQLIWKDTELTDEASLMSDLEAFKAELSDLLDWTTASYVHLRAILQT